MQKDKGYLLPAVAYTEDMVCQLVYYPDKPEYRRALLGSLAYLATWIAWEKEPEHKAKDASLSWKIALDATMECWQMACLEQLQDDVAAILAIMQIPQACCDPGDFTDGGQYTDRVVDGEGNVPQNIIDAGYASGTGDWAGFDDYKCMIAHVTINQLSARLLEIAPLVDASGAILGGVAALAGILAVVVGTGGLAIVFGIVAGIGATSLLYQAIADFGVVDTLAAKVVTNHDELACSIYEADGDAAALVALNAKIDELFTAPEALLLKNMNNGPTLKMLYAGRYDQQDIAGILDDAGYELGDFDCSGCDQIGEYYIFDDWNDASYAPLLKSAGEPTFMDLGAGEYGFRWRWDANPGHYIYYSVLWLRVLAGLAYGAGDTITINQIKFNYKMSAANAGDFKIYFVDDTGTRNYTATNVLVWTEKTIVLSPARVSTYNLNLILRIYLTGGAGNYGYVKDLTIDFDAS